MTSSVLSTILIRSKEMGISGRVEPRAVAARAAILRTPEIWKPSPALIDHGHGTLAPTQLNKRRIRVSTTESTIDVTIGK